MHIFVRSVYLFIVLSFAVPAEAQPVKQAELTAKLGKLSATKNYVQDTAYINTLNQLAFVYADSYPDSALAMLAGQAFQCKAIGYPRGESDTYKIMGNAFQTKGSYEKALEYYQLSYSIAEKNNYKKALPGLLDNIGLVHMNQGNYPEALNKFYETLKAAEATADKFITGSALNNIGIIQFYQGKMDEAEAAYKKTLLIAKDLQDTVGIILAYNNMGEVEQEQDKLSAALQNFELAYKLALVNNNPEMLAVVDNNLGNIYFKKDSLSTAAAHYNSGLLLAKERGYGTTVCKALIGLAKVQLKQGMLKQALVSSLEGLQKAEEMGQSQLVRDANEIAASIYEASGDDKNALKHYRLFKKYSDSLNNLVNERAAASSRADYEISKKQLAFERSTIQQRWLTFSAFAALVTLAVIVWIVNRNKRRLDHTYKDLQQKNLLIEAQKKSAEETLGQLKAAQAQLIQAEKMASLGELTAGIAHEIQNPLNFVNNFSELNIEMIAEMQQELSKGNYEEVRIIAGDIEANEDKINRHGKRADNIVKGMLQHSQSGKRQMESTDINLLVDEHLKLSYHGFKAKDKSFNCTFNTHFDNSIGTLSVIPQDIGRVVFNILTNAFYAVAEKKRQQKEMYDPAISISTKKTNEGVEIIIADNGNGIPPGIINKIFQPFFTTKPTGEGTGLGLSLSYDIVKAHNGELKVESKEGEGSEFTVVLRH